MGHFQKNVRVSLSNPGFLSKARLRQAQAGTFLKEQIFKMTHYQNC